MDQAGEPDAPSRPAVASSSLEPAFPRPGLDRAGENRARPAPPPAALASSDIAPAATGVAVATMPETGTPIEAQAPGVAAVAAAGGPARRDEAGRAETRVDETTASPPEHPTNGLGPARSTCTAPQLKRFIKSRVYVPMHELRRRFQINGGDDEVTVVNVGGGRVYIGLPDREGRLLGELLRGGDVGYELSLDPPTPIVVGLYPMRPIPRS